MYFEGEFQTKFMWSEQPCDEGVTLPRGRSGISKCIMLQKQQQGNDSAMWACRVVRSFEVDGWVFKVNGQSRDILLKEHHP